MKNPIQKNKTAKIAYTVTGTITNIFNAVEVIKQRETEPIDLWLLQTNPILHKRLAAEKQINRVFVSPVRDRTFSNPDHNVQAIPVYGKYDDVIHLGNRVRLVVLDVEYEVD